MSADAWGTCSACGERLCRENASRLRSGAVVHVGCQAGRSALAAALRKGDAELPDEEPAPLVQASGPTDYEALGRERYHDTPEADRSGQLPRILEQTKAGAPEPDRRFADGWMAEHSRALRAASAPTYPKVRRRVSLRDPAAPAGLRLAGIGGEVHRGLVEEVTRAAAEPKADVVLQALHVAGGANGIGVGEVRPLQPPQVDAVLADDVSRDEPPTPDQKRAVLRTFGPPLSSSTTRPNIDVRSDRTGISAPSDEPDWNPYSPAGAQGPQRDAVSGVLALFGWIFGIWDDALYGPIHLTVPLFVGSTCCSGKPHAARPVTYSRSRTTCTECLAVLDDTDALGDRIEELQSEHDGEERDARAARERRSAEQLDMLCDQLPPDPLAAEGTVIHLFADPGRSSRARCGVAVRSEGRLEKVVFILGHHRCCEVCGLDETRRPRATTSSPSVPMAVPLTAIKTAPI